MDDKLFELLDDLNISDTDLLLNENINLSMDLSSRKRIEESVKKKTGYLSKKDTFNNNMKNILGGTYMKRKIALAASIAVAFSLGGGVYAYAKTPVAYVSLDINPSVELGVNAFDTVVSAEAYNKDGEKVLEGTNLVNTKVDNAVSTVITNAISDGYIKEDSTNVTTSAAVEITVSTDKDGLADKLNESLKETADETLKDNDLEAEVETDKVALARRDEARQLGITPGKLNLIQKLQALDPSIKVEDYKLISVKEIQKKAKELRKMTRTDNDAVDVDNSVDTNTNATDSNTNTETDTNTSNSNQDADVTSESTEDITFTQSSIGEQKTKEAKTEKSNDSWNEKSNNGNLKKEENSNAGIKQEENEDKKYKKSSNGSEKRDAETHGNSNSSKSEKSNNGNSDSKGKGNDKNK
ncbi:anti-sigma-I factor RsgI family protein [Candidatus Clostridium helianthi]|uniref:Anti-sigma factor RsgI-like middle domain-containing protein n=1 Tax=Candidatus Clostridium helianthi TaxID=3381660 RepID=A0ABW8S293_9CLOT